MKVLRILASVICLAPALIAAQALAQDVKSMTAASLEEHCKKRTDIERGQFTYEAALGAGACAGYMNGALGAYYFLAQEYRNWICLPSNATADQAARIFLKYLSDNPQELHKPAIGIVLLSWAATFPCKP